LQGAIFHLDFAFRKQRFRSVQRGGRDLVTDGAVPCSPRSSQFAGNASVASAICFFRGAVETIFELTRLLGR
jgi:hypothetical protein